MRGQLESVFFLNPAQVQWLSEIREIVEKYGVPEVREISTELRLVLRGQETAQTLFALSSEPPNLLEGVIIIIDFTTLKF